MNICLVSQEYPPDTVRGGVGVQTFNKATALSRLGHAVHVLSAAATAGPDIQTEEHDGVIVHRMQPPDSTFPVYQTPTYWVGYSWAVLRHLHDLMKQTRFDVIDFPEYGAEGFAYQLDRTAWNFAPVVVQLHAPLAMFVEKIGCPEKSSDFFRVGSMMEELSIRRADAVMACSANIADFTAGYYGLDRDGIDVVHCGVDAEAFRPNATDSAPARPTVLFVGNIVANKGVEQVLEAVLRLRGRHPDILLQVVGRVDDDLVPALQRKVELAGGEANVELTGFVHRDRLPEFYRKASVFCSPASYEGGVANVYLEAMACGCPVIASTAGGAPEAVIHGRTGFLVPPSNVDAVVEAIDNILADDELRQRMGTEGRKRIEEYFAMDKYIQRILSVYRKAIDRASATKLQLERSST